MKINLSLHLCLFILIILFCVPEITLAVNQLQQNEEKQRVEEKHKNQKTKDDKGINKEQVSNKNDDFEYDLLIHLLGIFVSASLIIYQLGRQHKNNFNLQRQNNREKLKLEIYTEYRKKISDASDKVHSPGTKARLIVTHFNIYVIQLSTGITPIPISDRELAFREAHFAAIDSISDLIFLLEEYKIVNPNLEIFGIALSYASHCMTEAFNPLQQELLEFLPYDIPPQDQENMGTDVIFPVFPSKDDLKRISDLAQSYCDAAMDTSGYVHDLAIEAQNIFLGSLFSQHLQHRKPIDPKLHVISTAPDEVVKLKKYFLEETEWGKNMKGVEEEIKQEIKKGQNNS